MTDDMPSARERWLELRRRGWADPLGRFVTGALAFLTLGGLYITLGPFGAFNQHSVLTHTLVGLVFTPLFVIYTVRHLRVYLPVPLTHVKFSGWGAGILTLACVVSGLVLTGQGLFGTRITYAWRATHLVTTVGVLLFVVPHLGTLAYRELRRGGATPVVAALRAHVRGAGVWLALGSISTFALWGAVRPVSFVNEFPPDYDHSPYEGAGPFSPSLATTATGGAFDPRSLAGSASCGSSGCHQEIYEEWLPSAHRYASMDAVFQAVQGVMAQQNGPTSTRYCAGCHDPISLFQGSKDFGNEDLTSRIGYDEGVSCLACHAIEQTDVQGNANYVMHQPERYVWELREGQVATLLRDFLIRTYPDGHVNSLSRRMFKTPEFCAACHKQFIDREVNKVGWVQLQNQYDNWRASRWNHPDDPTRTLECRECHMPLADSRDPAAGDEADFNREPSDGKHRSHRFLGANQFIPILQELEGGAEHVALVERWLRGELEVPEIEERWKAGPAVPILLEVPESVRPGESVPLRVQVVNNKVGHDFPTGPLDIIQSWVEVTVTDQAGQVVFHTGEVGPDHFIETGTFMFKAEPVDRYGNLIDRHNLWEMVGVRFKRSLFPGAAEVARFDFPCPGGEGQEVQDLPVERGLSFDAPRSGDRLRVEAKLNYRKVDQYLLNMAFGEGTEVTSPITVISTASAEIRIDPGPVERK